MTALKRPSAEQIRTEIATLFELKPNVRQYSGFGDDHHAAIEAQVSVLEQSMTTDDVYDSFGDEAADDFAQNVLDEALRAADWLEGETDEAPSVGWQDLAQV